MRVETLIEGQEALQVAAFGVVGGLGVPDGLGLQVQIGELAKLCLAVSIRATTL